MTALCVPTQAAELLQSWGLNLDARMLDLQGRRLPPEKILFKNSSIVANMEADWSRECLKEHVISAVSHPVCCHVWVMVRCD